MEIRILSEIAFFYICNVSLNVNIELLLKANRKHVTYNYTHTIIGCGLPHLFSDDRTSTILAECPSSLNVLWKIECVLFEEGLNFGCPHTI